MNRLIKPLALVMLSVLTTHSYSQGHTTVVPPSGQVIASYAGVESNNASGMAPHNIPVYNIHSGKLSHGITLSYHTPGNRVDDVASWVGLGFSLDVGGSIVRTVRGLPDEKTDGFFNGSPTKATVLASNTLLQKAADNMIDTHPDLFTYNFDGYSGKMYFDRSGLPHLLPQRNFKIYSDPTLFSFTIVVENGTRYSFTAKESARVSTTGFHASLTTDFTSTWLLTYIQAADQSAAISFEYATPVTWSKSVTGDEATYKTLEVVTNFSHNGSSDQIGSQTYDYTITYTTPVLDKVSFHNGYMTFDRSGRLDSSFPRLNAIKLYYSDNTLYKSFNFNYDYHVYQPSVGNSQAVRKLKLLKFWEQSATMATDPYTFDYYPQYQKVDNTKIYKSTDRWGFFSGVTQNSQVPAQLKMFGPDPPGPHDFTFVPGPTMIPDLSATQTFMLKKVTYPTGGFTTFDYELNTAQFSFPIDPIIQSPVIKVATGDITTKLFTISTTLSDYRGAAATMIVTSKCGPIDSDPCAIAPAFLSDCPYIELLGPANFSWSCKYLNDKYEFFLPVGSYQLRVSTNLTKTFSAELQYVTRDPIINLINKPTGGLRLLRTTSYTSQGDLKPIVKKYTYNDDLGKTTGKLNSDLDASYKKIEYSGTPAHGSPVPGVSNCYGKELWTVVSTSTIRGGLVPSFTTMYSRITELHGENGENGKIEYSYNNANGYVSGTDGSDTGDYRFSVDSWRKGLQEKKAYFRKEGALFKKVKEEITHYDFDSYPNLSANSIGGYSVGIIETYGGGCTVVQPHPTFVNMGYTIQSDWFFVDKTTTIDYDSQENPQTVNNVMTYDYNNLMLTKSIADTSIPEEKVVTSISYPDNYSDATGTFISDLKTYHVVSLPIEQVTYRQYSPAGGPVTNKMFYGTVTTYKRGDNTIANYIGRVDAVYNLVTPGGQPIPQASFTFTNSTLGTLPVNSAPFALTTSQFTKQLTVTDNDQVYSIPTAYYDRNGIPTVSRMGYNGTYVICKAVNSSIVKYTSFETSSDDHGWLYTGALIAETALSKAKTGKKYYDLANGNITATSLDNTKTYRVTFWAKGGTPTVSNVTGGNTTTGLTDNDGWKYFSRIISGTTTLTISTPGGSLLIDELAFAEDKAIVETFTYDTFKGITSSSDSNGRVITQSYDELGRPKTTRDEKGDIVETYRFGRTSNP